MQLLALARNFCVARLIAPDEFGIAATFALTLSMLEAVADLSFDKMMVQDRDGENPVLQAVLQALTLARGALVAALIWLAAPLIAQTFGVPEAEPAYRWLALAALFRGLVHLDIRRVQRRLDFAREVRLTLAAQAAGFVVAVGLAWVWRDHRAVLAGLLASALVTGLGSHLLADRRYRLALAGPETRRALRFGWPLMLNGMVLMLATQADRALVGAFLGVEALALYAVVVMTLEAALQMLTRSVSRVALPWLAEAQGTAAFLPRYRVFSDALALLAAAVFAPFALVGTGLVGVVFGAAYRGPELLAGALALVAALRLMRQAPIGGALAIGDTASVLVGNLARLSGIGLAALVLAGGGGLAGIAGAMALGELAAWVTASLRLRRRARTPVRSAAAGLAVLLAGFALALPLAALLPPGPSWLRWGLAAGLALAGAAAVLALSPDLRGRLLRRSGG